MESYQQDFGAFVKAVRKRNGYSQDHFAEITDLSPTYLNSVERGLVDPRLSTLKKIAAGLDVPMPDLFSFDLDGNLPDDKKKRFCNLIAKMPPEAIDDLYSLLLEGLAGRCRANAARSRH